jgi:hypothetical protein
MLGLSPRRKLPSAVFWWVAVGAIVLAGCYYSKAQRDALDIPLAPTAGHVRSPEFQTHLPYMYDIGIGIKSATVPEVRCIAIAPPGGEGDRTTARVHSARFSTRRRSMGGD